MRALGDVFSLSWSDQTTTLTAEVTEVAAGLRSLRVNGAAIVPEYPVDAPRPFASGIILAPWANRIRDGRWERDGVSHQLWITEVVRNNAIHGLLRFAPYAVAARTESAITLTATIYPQAGYPYLLENRVTYSLGADGLTVAQEIENVGDGSAPVMLGAHPFLTIPGVHPREVTLTGPSTTVMTVDERLLPTGSVPAEGQFDLSSGQRLAGLFYDHGFGSPRRGDDGRAVHTLRADDGRAVSMWGDAAADFWQVFTPDADAETVNVAIEPMSASVDAFNTGDGLRVLGTGDTFAMTWGITAEGF